MEGKFLFLGTGGSMGTPVITCSCAVCRSTNPFNHRLRPSGMIKIGGKQLLIDAGPDIRAQALTYGIHNLDGLLLTHTHFDHTAGLDDLRVFYFIHKRVLPCLLSEESLTDLKRSFPYFFTESDDDVMGGARFRFQVLPTDFGTVPFEGFNFQVMSYSQKGMKVTGYRLGSFAYVVDVRDFDDRLIAALQGVEVLVLSALRSTPSPAHLTFDEAISVARRVGAKKTYFTHISHHSEHEETNNKLPPDIRLAYDGLEINFHVV